MSTTFYITFLKNFLIFFTSNKANNIILRDKKNSSVKITKSKDKKSKTTVCIK